MRDPATMSSVIHAVVVVIQIAYLKMYVMSNANLHKIRTKRGQGRKQTHNAVSVGENSLLLYIVVDIFSWSLFQTVFNASKQRIYIYTHTHT